MKSLTAPFGSVSARFAARFSALAAPVRGALWMLAAAALLTGMSASVHQLSASMHTFEIVFFRVMLGIPFMAPWLIRTRFAGLRTRRLKALAVRGLFTLFATNCFFGALALAPLADATAIMFSRPLFASALAILFLHETVNGRRWTAMAAGFAGVLIIVQPGFAEINTGLLLAMAGALFGAITALMVRYLARTESPDTITIYYAIFMTAFSIWPALFVWRTPTWEESVLILFMGFVGTLGQRAMARAMSIADISVVLPIDFTRLVFAAGFGWALFAEIPGLWTWIGGGVIFAASVYIARTASRAAAASKTG